MQDGIFCTSVEVENQNSYFFIKVIVSVASGADANLPLLSTTSTQRKQVRELEQLSAAEGTTTSELCEKLRSVAAEFVSPDSATEVNVKGSSRQDVLCSIQAALEAADYNYGGDDNDGYGGGGGGGGRNGESPWARVLTIAATEALVGLARQVHTVIFDGIWPRFLGSDEFAVLMKREVRACVCDARCYRLSFFLSLCGRACCWGGGVLAWLPCSAFGS